MISRRHALAALFGALAAPRSARAAAEVELSDLYRAGSGPTDMALELEGDLVRVRGFMAPPLKAETRFFVLTLTPMPICPFCDEDADWSEQLLAIYAKRLVEPAPFWKQIAVTGLLRLGAFRDPETDFLSQVRLEEAAWETA